MCEQDGKHLTHRKLLLNLPYNRSPYSELGIRRSTLTRNIDRCQTKSNILFGSVNK